MRLIVQHCAAIVAAVLLCLPAHASRVDTRFPAISYIQLESFDIVAPDRPLTIGAQLRTPESDNGDLPAVVILHGSAGLDSRGELYAEALNNAGIATLEIDMWAARGVTGGGDRPPLPTFTLPDAFAALDFLAKTEGIDANRIGVLGFSWGGVMSMLSATEAYAESLGNGRQFAAHVAHYPICWGYTVGIPGISFDNLTGAPVLIQVGSRDDYDDGSAPCENLAAPFPEVDVRVYRNAYHAWDRLQPRLTVDDPFAHQGQGGEVKIVPNPGKARQSTRRVVNHFSDVFGL